MAERSEWHAMSRGGFASAKRVAKTVRLRRRDAFAAANRPGRINITAALLLALAVPALYFLAILVATVIGEFTAAG